MRKQKVEIEGFLDFVEEDGSLTKVEISNLGAYVKPSFSGLLDGPLVNNRLFTMELQSSGFKVSYIFHYDSVQEMKNKRETYLSQCKQALIDVLKNNYQRIPNEINLNIKKVYDVDYADLSLAEMQNDLTQHEIEKVLKNSQSYSTTVINERKQSVFFE